MTMICFITHISEENQKGVRIMAMYDWNHNGKNDMPKVTPHVCRHTFCSRMAAARMNPKTLQYIMGHSDIGVTLNVYTHLGFDEASEEINRIAKEKKKQPAVKEEKITELKVVGV